MPSALLALTGIYAFGIPGIKSQFDEGVVGPQFLPLLLVFCALLALMAIFYRSLSEIRQSGEGACQDEGVDRMSALRPFMVFLVILAYVAAFKPAGFVISTLGLAFGILWIFEYAAQNIMLRLAVSVLLTGLAYILFAVAFGTRLPLFPGLI